MVLSLNLGDIARGDDREAEHTRKTASPKDLVGLWQASEGLQQLLPQIIPSKITTLFKNCCLQRVNRSLAKHRWRHSLEESLDSLFLNYLSTTLHHAEVFCGALHSNLWRNFEQNCLLLSCLGGGQTPWTWLLLQIPRLFLWQSFSYNLICSAAYS